MSLALQVFYPESFNGCWSSCPDGVDFRNFQLIDIYSDTNAYVSPEGIEYSAMRNRSGKSLYTVRHESRLERVLGGGRWEWGGQQWASWNAVYGPRGAHGPRPLWDGETGQIDREVLEHWKRYDLRLVLERNWPKLGPQLRGKIHIWVGSQDEYYLNLAVERFKECAETLSQPSFDGEIIIAPGKGHVTGWKHAQLMDLMYQRMQLAPES